MERKKGANEDEIRRTARKLKRKNQNQFAGPESSPMVPLAQCIHWHKIYLFIIGRFSITLQNNTNDNQL